MKSRPHRLTVSEPHHDDWVDGSWTVDCVCGVNYDDGEEMVDCDECGVWVHTRCFHFVKSEKSFYCDKCKSKNNARGVPDDSEETEVAEFLLELPTKTLRMDNPSPASVAPRRLLKLWTDVPSEDRGHVQGLPGGEPGLLSGSGMSSIFCSELWKSAGYVPKKFNFRYCDFQRLNLSAAVEKEQKELDKTNGEEIGNQADSGAGVLFSLLKENNKTLLTPAVDSFGVKSPVKYIGEHGVGSLGQKSLGAEGPDNSGPDDSINKETSSSVPVVLRSGKHRKDKHGMLMEQSVTKTVRTVEEREDARKWDADSSKGASSTFSSDVKYLKSSQGRGLDLETVSGQCLQNVLPDQQAYQHSECATNLDSKEHGLEATPRNAASSDEVLKKESRDHVPVRSEKFSKTDNRVELLTELNGSSKQPVNEESGGDAGEGVGNGKIWTRDKDHVDMDMKIGSAAETKECRQCVSSDIDESNSRPNKKLKGDLITDDLRHLQVKPLPPNDSKLDTMKVPSKCPDSAVNIFLEEGRLIESSVISSEASNQKLSDVTRRLNIGTSRTDKSGESPSHPCQYKRQPTNVFSTGARKKSSGLEYSTEVADDESHKSNVIARSHSPAAYQREGVSLVKSTSTLVSNISKPSDAHITANTQNPSHIRQNRLSDSTVAAAKDSPSADAVTREEKSGRPKKLVTDYSRHLPKIPESTKLSHTSYAKKTSSDYKGPNINSSSNVTLVPNATPDRVLGENTSSLQVESVPNIANKAASSPELVKVQKLAQSSGHQSSRGNMAPMTASTLANVSATLSDEELALLLHQELNSSPRVPRVPRMRHAGILPQLTGPSATTVLVKRTSIGGKDHNVASRRTKDFPGECLNGSMGVVNEAGGVDRKPTSPDNRRRDSDYNAGMLPKREAHGSRDKSVQFVKKTSTCSSISSSPHANGNSVPPIRPSSRITSDDSTQTAGHQTIRTLPGLIAEIMHEGKRMTYEELCNAVLPHWPHLRKHNGERYAYSSHSQAVLDCLRNRNEWSRLVDRGPKSTPSSRKRRKVDGESMSIESEDNEDNVTKAAKESYESQQEDFPEGKRNARKQRRLGGGAVPPTRRRRADVVSDDESEEISSSSEENSVSSDEEMQGGGVGGSEASASSDDV